MILADRIDDPFKTLWTFGNFPDVEFQIKGIKLPGTTLGSPIDTTTMENTRYFTMAFRKLRRMSPVTLVCAYSALALDPDDGIAAMLGINQLCTATLSDNSTYAVWAGVNDFEFSENTVEGPQPTVSIIVIPTMQNASNVETDPVFTPAP